MELILFALSLLLFCVQISNGRVSIIDSYRPMYVAFGGNLTLTCESNQRRQLEWVQDIPDTGWSKQKIVPLIGGNIETRYTVIEPSGVVLSTLTKQDIRLEDRGMYQCQDDVEENSFALWVTVLMIQRVDERALPNESVDLYCTLLGFETNVPHIDYHWYYKEMEIITANNKYDLVHRDGISQLTINVPVREDGGDYTCSFTLQTNKEPVTLTANVYLDADDLASSASTHVVSSKRSLLTVTITTILALVTMERLFIFL